MFPNNNLPLIVVENILRYALATIGSRSIKNWKQKLQLLGICRGWRCVGMLLVYSDVYFQSPATGPAFSKGKGAASNAETKMLQFNISLTDTIGATYYIRNMHVGITRLSDFCMLYKILLLMHKKNPQYWEGITTLTMDLRIAETPHNDVIDSSLQYSAQAQHTIPIVAFIKNNMFKVAKVTFSGSYKNKTVKSFYNSLIDQLSNQLKHITNTAHTSLSAPKLSDNLTHLIISLDKNSTKILPRICAQKLKQLILYDTPHSFSWKYFQNELSPGDIYFSNLKELEIWYYLGDSYSKADVLPDSWRYKSNSGDKYKVHFPSLKKLNITHRPPDTDISFADNYPEHINQTKITDMFLAEKSFDNSNIKSVGNIVVSYYMLSKYTEYEFYRASNYMFGQINITNRASLHLSCKDQILNLNLITWPNLNYLRLGMIDYNKVIHLLPLIPGLEDLSIFKLTCDTQNVYESNNVVKPLKTGLKNIFIERNSIALVEKIMLCIKQLMVQVESLRKFGMYESVIEMSEFVNGNSKKYPHLKSIVFYNKLEILKSMEKISFM